MLARVRPELARRGPSNHMRRVTRPASLVAAIGLIQACGHARVDRPPTRIVIAAGPTDGVFRTVGEALATAYNRLPGIHASAQHSLNSRSSADAIERGEADLALEGARTSYIAYRRGTSSHPPPHTRLRALAVLFPTVVHIATRRDSGIRQVAGLRGRRIFVGAEGSPTEEAARVVLESHGLTLLDVHPVFDRDVVTTELATGQLDGLFLFLPVEHAFPVAVMRDAGARLISIDSSMMEPIRSRDPLLKPASIVKGTYQGQSETVATVGTDVLLVCREDLPEELVYQLTKTLFESIGELSRAHRSAETIDPDRGPAATIPLHRGAARYYRERELFR